MISRVEIENFRIFKEKFLLENLGIPDGSTPGSGMTVLLGENGCGKTSILDAIAVALNRNYAENFSFEDLRNKEKITSIHVESNEKFPVQMATQGSTFNATGFYFEGKFREVDTSLRLSKLITKKRSYKPVKGIAEEVNLKIDVLNDHGVERHSDFNILYLGKNRTSQIKPG
ncbi:MAG TPA: ATP-binding protein, partial [Candidatus Paceibacterota bacterium]|nr:ATP-binding protein [Candidatus Paceibacterota bacterium]